METVGRDSSYQRSKFLYTFRESIKISFKYILGYLGIRVGISSTIVIVFFFPQSC